VKSLFEGFTSRKSLSFVIEQSHNDTLRLEVSDKVLFLALAELVSKPQDNEYRNSLAQALSTIASRSVDSSCTIVTCVSRSYVATLLMIISKDLNEALYQRDVVCALIETLTEGSVVCRLLKPREALTAIQRCLGLKHAILLFDNTTPRSILPMELHRSAYWPIPSVLGYEDLEFVLQYLEKGKIKIGTLLENSDIEVLLKDEHLLRHIAVFGSTGSGKSTTAAVIAAQASMNGYTVFVIDWHGEYFELLKNLNNVVYTNPVKGSIPSALDLTKLIRDDTLAFIEILESALELTPAQAHILEDAVNYVKDKFTTGYLVDILVDIVQSSSASARWYSESREALLRKLKPLTSQYLRIRWDQCKTVEAAPNTIMVFDISSIPNTRVRKTLAALLVRSITLKSQYNELPKPILIIVDEAHNIFDSKSPLSVLVAEVRKWHIGFVIVTQSPSMVASVVVKNTNTKIVHLLKSSQDVDSVLATIPNRRNLAQILSSLRPGEALLSLPELPLPLLVRIDTSVLRGVQK